MVALARFDSPAVVTWRRAAHVAREIAEAELGKGAGPERPIGWASHAEFEHLVNVTSRTAAPLPGRSAALAAQAFSAAAGGYLVAEVPTRKRALALALRGASMALEELIDEVLEAEVALGRRIAGLIDDD